jgi:hypothetical protein
MIRFRSHSIAVILAFFLLVFLEGSAWARNCSFAVCSPTLPFDRCNPLHAEGAGLADVGGKDVTVCGNAGNTASTNCPYQHTYDAATNTYGNSFPTPDFSRDFSNRGQVIAPCGAAGHQDPAPAGASSIPNSVLAALSTVVLLI